MNKHEWIQSLDIDAFVELIGNIQAKAIERGRALTEQEYLNLLKEGKTNEQQRKA